MSDDENEIDLWTREETPLLRILVGPQQSIQIAQYASDNDRWGIYSCVWDGGLGLIEYLRTNPVQRDTLIIDLGAGTGIVGIGLAALGYTNVVVTDLMEAIGLLKENAQHNSNHMVEVEELAWGEPTPLSIQNRLNSATDILLIGADIVYRKNLFDPLLSTLEQLWSQNTKCLFATQSTRLHLDDFWSRAQERGFTKHHISNVLVPQGIPEKLPVLVPRSDEKKPGVVQVLEITKAVP